MKPVKRFENDKAVLDVDKDCRNQFTQLFLKRKGL